MSKHNPAMGYKVQQQIYSYDATRWGYPCLAWVDQPAPPPSPSASLHLNLTGLVINFNKNFCCSFFFLLRIFFLGRSLLQIQIRKLRFVYSHHSDIVNSFPWSQGDNVKQITMYCLKYKYAILLDKQHFIKIQLGYKQYFLKVL